MQRFKDPLTSDITTSHPSGQHLQSLNRLMSSCYTYNDLIMDYY